MKRKKMMLSGLVVLLLLLAFWLGNWFGLSEARTAPPVVVARDASDSKQSSGKSEHDAYFTKQNPIPEKVK